MKKYLVFAALLALLVLVAGCDLLGLGAETWSYTASGGGFEACVEVTTSNSDLKAALEDSGLYVQEPCDVSNPTGTCEVTEMAGYTAYDAVWTYHYGGYDEATAQTFCDALNGNWEAN